MLTNEGMKFLLALMVIGLAVLSAGALVYFFFPSRSVRVLPSMGERVTSEFLDNWKKDDSIKLRIPVISKIYGRVLGMRRSSVFRV